MSIPKTFLLAGALAVAHFSGVIPHEKPILRWGIATSREVWRHLRIAATHSKTASALSGLVEHRLYRAVATSANVQAIAPGAPGITMQAPPCSLQQLNEEYRKVLHAHRRQVSPSALVARFDPVLFKGCRRFNRQLEAENVLRHDPQQPCAEIAGSSTAPLPKDPVVLARLIYTSFSNSPHHALIQADEKLDWVAVSSTAHYFVVRLNYHPTRPDE